MALYPCAYSMTFNVSGNTLNGILNQRSQDMLTANGWNVMQYAVLLHMVAQVSGLEAGELVHVIADAISNPPPRAGGGGPAPPPPRPPPPPAPPRPRLLPPPPPPGGPGGGSPPPLCRERSRWRSKRRRTVWNLIVAVDQNWAIGKDGEQLLYLSQDLKRFKALTLGHAVILGRRTLSTFPGGRP